MGGSNSRICVKYMLDDQIVSWEMKTKWKSKQFYKTFM